MIISSQPVREGDAGSALHQVQQSWSPYSRIPRGARSRLRQLWSSIGFNHGTASQLRYELDMVLLRSRCAMSVTFRRQVRRLAAGRHLLVHLGCGNALIPGWVNVDCYTPPPAKGVEVLTCDMRRGLPLTSGSVDAIFSEHFLEHLPFQTVAKTILPEMNRILAPGGRVRIGVPDGEYFVEQYLAHRSGKCDPLFDLHRGGKTPMIMLNEIAHGFGHHFAYDFETLAQLLRAAGFINVARRSPFTTESSHFEGKDRLDEWRNAMTLYAEAQAPHACGATPP